jgi:chemotaxis protein methyltransferase CheR
MALSGLAALSEAQFRRIAQRMYEIAGITLPRGKETLVRSRLAGRLRLLGLADYGAYLTYLDQDASGVELTAMVDALTTNKTSFFRESAHFDLLEQRVLPELARRNRPIRIWSAGCSSGEEAYTIAMLLRDHVPQLDRLDARILATDISTRMLARAQAAVYDADGLRDVPQDMRRRHFAAVPGQPRVFQVSEATRKLVRVAQLNLMADWPMRGPFDVIFCRNVMIYFDKPTQERLVQRFWRLLAPGGYLLVGHSESLTALAHEFRYVQPAAYLR